MKKVLFFIIIVLLTFIILAKQEEQNSKTLVFIKNTEKWTTPAMIHEEWWSIPKKLEFNDDGWEDSPFISRDGQKVYFFYHPFDDILTRWEEYHNYVVNNTQEAIANGMDGKVYVSHYPFQTKEVYPLFDVDGPELTCCFSEAATGEKYWTSNKQAWDLMEAIPSGVYKNGELLDLWVKHPDNAFYNTAYDELWFDCPSDKNICIHKNGKTIEAPYPINDTDMEKIEDFQPFLTDDGKTLYFSSTRGEGNKIAIYRSERQENNSWSEPELFVSHPDGVAEISMSTDGSKMTFVQIFWKEKWGVGIDIWYSEKKQD